MSYIVYIVPEWNQTVTGGWHFDRREDAEIWAGQLRGTVLGGRVRIHDNNWYIKGADGPTAPPDGHRMGKPPETPPESA